MKNKKQKMQMRIILGILVGLVLLLSTIGIALGIKNCNADPAPGSSSGTDGSTPGFQLPVDEFQPKVPCRT